eukprot:scaffold4261_cov110-Isochrysis_galbana.AAC.7
MQRKDGGYSAWHGRVKEGIYSSCRAPAVPSRGRQTVRPRCADCPGSWSRKLRWSHWVRL